MTRPATPVVELRGGIADRHTGPFRNRDTAAVRFSCPSLGNQMGGDRDARARRLTLALGRIIGA